MDTSTENNPTAAWPPPEKLKGLVHKAKRAAALEQRYTRTFACRVKSCDEYGQLALHQHGVIEPFTRFAEMLAARLGEESLSNELSGSPEKGAPGLFSHLWVTKS
jgi:hypothetical protein